MSITTSYKEALHNKIFEVISQASQQLNVDSYVIGGFVRDLILKEILKRHRYCCCGSE
jgi:tRNA nucleotidyltransferase (CCA-adding enzyme)